MSDETTSLNRLIEEADLNSSRTREAQHRTAIEIRQQDPELAALLDQLWPDTFKQATWLFRRLSREPNRPVDLIASGQSSKVHELAQAILHGVFQ